ncbi:MAG TPA: carbohydrate porin [Candidatus Methylacidiphilales bacterium]
MIPRMKLAAFLLSALAVPSLLFAGDAGEIALHPAKDPKQVVDPKDAAAPCGDQWDKYLFGDWGGVRRTLDDYGVTSAPGYTGEVFGNLKGGSGAGYSSGGVGRGAIYEHLVNVPLDVDIGKLSGALGGKAWEGTTFHVNGFWIAGPGLSPSYLGDIHNTSNIQAYNTVRLQELWVQQLFLDKKVSLKAGQLAADTEFFVTETGCLFLNSSFGFPSLIAANLTDPHLPPSYPTAAPGLRLRVEPRPEVYFQAGLYDGNAESQSANPNGTDFHFNTESGALVLAEAGYLLHPGDPQPGVIQGKYKLGAVVHTHNFNSWQSQAANAAGTGALVSGGADALLYGVIDQQVVNTKDGRIVSLFTRAGHGSADRNQIDWYVDGGTNFCGFVPGRPDDVFGLAVARSAFSGHYSDFQFATGAAARPYGAETTIEATYRFQLRPWWTLQPDFQYVFQPGGVEGAQDAVVLGLRTSVQF